jgi:hypothetical protein
MLLKSDVLKSAMLNYLNSIKLDQVEDAQVRNTLSRITLEALRTDILTRGNYKIGSPCQDSYNHEVPASAQIGDEGGEICFNTNLISDQLKERTIEEGFIRLAALAFHEHVHHLQSRWTNVKKNEDEAYRVADYVLLTAKTVQMPSLKWSVAATNIPIGSSVDESPLSTLAHGTKIQIPLNAVIAAQKTQLGLGGDEFSQSVYDLSLSCSLVFPSSSENRVLTGTLQIEVDHIDESLWEDARIFGGVFQKCRYSEKIAGKYTINGAPRSDIQVICTSSYSVSMPHDCRETWPYVSAFRRVIENAGGVLTPTPAVQF